MTAKSCAVWCALRLQMRRFVVRFPNCNAPVSRLRLVFAAVRVLKDRMMVGFCCMRSVMS